MKERIQFVLGVCILALLIAGLAILIWQDANAATPDRIQTCSALAPAGYTGTATVGCPTANLSWGPALTTDLVRTIQNGSQVWVPYSTLTANSQVVLQSTGKWSTLGTITVTPAPAAPAPSPAPAPPPPAPADVTVSVDGAPSYEPVVYSQLTSGACFTLSSSAGKAAHVCLPQ